MIRVHQIVIVEGKYDRHTLSNFLDASIIETGGFAIFKNKPLTDTLKKLAPQRGLIILTDSDRAGFAIRNYLCGIIDNRYITHVYIPDIHGKERRKKAPSKEGLLGVEGVYDPEYADEKAWEKRSVPKSRRDRGPNAVQGVSYQNRPVSIRTERRPGKRPAAKCHKKRIKSSRQSEYQSAAGNIKYHADKARISESG